MLETLKQWYYRYFSDPAAVALLASIIVIYLLFATMGSWLIPVLVALVFAYLLDWIVSSLERVKMPHSLAVVIVYLLFIGVVVLAIVGLLPVLTKQLANLINEFPKMIAEGQGMLLELQEKFPAYVNADQLKQFLSAFKTDFAKAGQHILTWSISTIPSLFMVIIYLVLVPLLIYFFLIDRDLLIGWARKVLPRERGAIDKVITEVNLQTGNYVRGKVIEVLINAFVSYIAFLILGLNYAALLAALVGLSVIIPYVGAVIVTIPVALIALFQWGMTSQFLYLAIVYTIILTFDAQVIVPLLFSGALKLHPIAIIVAILVFGGLWGFWGVFFAIPLASLVKAIVMAWPVVEVTE